MAKCQHLRTAPYCLELFEKKETKTENRKSHQAENEKVKPVSYSPKEKKGSFSLPCYWYL